MTLSSNIDEYRTSILEEELPRIFRDAIYVTRYFKIEHLWIDSLCIIQDSTADWDKEAARMANVYSNAYLTIAASKSADSNGYLTSGEEDMQLYTYSTKQIECTIYARRSVDHFCPAAPEPPFVLLSRGWVWQERLLSPRFLHFGPQEMVLECRSSNICECGYEQWPSEGWPKYMHSKSIAKGDLDDIAQRWRVMVCNYTYLNLTFESDRLPAISGLVKDIRRARTSDDDYCAGVWKKSLADDLCWQSNTIKTRPAEYRGPSWSWASVGGRVTYPGEAVLKLKPDHDDHDENPNVFVVVIDCHVRPWSPDHPDGEVLFGYLLLQNHLQPASLRYVTYSNDEASTDFEVAVHGTGEEPIELETFHAEYPLDALGKGHLPDGSGIYVLKIVEAKSAELFLEEEAEGEEKRLRIYLVLRMVNTEDTMFTRNGLATHTSVDEGSKHEDPLEPYEDDETEIVKIL